MLAEPCFARNLGRRLPIPLGIFVSMAVCASATAAEPGARPDCGVNSLFLLLEFEARPTTLDRLDRALPERRSDGYSMAELAAASRSLGLPLEGVDFGKGDAALDRPAIAFFQDAQAGHFALLRPVGTRVQVIDPPLVPRIVDYPDLFAARTWTGRLLLRRDPWPVRHRASLLAASASGALLALAWWRRRSRRARTEPVDPAGLRGVGLRSPGHTPSEASG